MRAPNGAAVGATVTAPQPLTLGDEMPLGTLGACVGLQPSDVVVRHHQPRWASTGNDYVIAEVTGAALSRAAPDVASFRRAAERLAVRGRLSVYLYARADRAVRARMFAPLAGTFEDPATGSAAAPLAGLLLSLDRVDDTRFDIVQGVEMGRPSRLHVTARRDARGIMTTVGGSCVPVMEGELTL